MPITKSAKKALRQNLKRKALNIRYRKKFKGLIKDFKKAVSDKDLKKANELIPKVYKSVDKAAKHGTIKKNTASRYKSRLARKAEFKLS